jgi:hypothetical protein
MNKYFKISVYVLALLLVCAAQAVGTVTVYVNDTGSDQGTTVDIPIMVSSTSNIGATDISLTYDPDVISVTGVVANGTLIAATDLIANHTATSGIVNISVASLYGINGTGSIAVIQFHVDGSSSETSPLTLSRAEAYDLDDPIYDGDGNCTGYAELDVTADNATFTVGAGLPQDGNINGIGGVTLADAIYLAKHVAQMSGYETLHADGNINGIGGVTLADAIYLAKHVAGMSGYDTLY